MCENNLLLNVTVIVWDMALSTLVDECQSVEGTSCLHVYDSDYLKPKDGRTIFLRNVDNLLTYYSELNLSRSKMEHADPTKAYGEGKIRE